MASFEITDDARTGLVRCRVFAFVSDAEADDLASGLKAAVMQARSRGPLRMMFDNTAGKVFSAHAKEALDRAMKATNRPDDRTAVLVADSINRLQAKRSMSEGTCVFVSEAEALDWLGA